MLAIATTGATDYGTAQELLGLEPFHSGRLATFTARLRQDGILEPVTAAICQLARKLAARQLGIRNANLTSQVRQLETTVGTGTALAGHPETAFVGAVTGPANLTATVLCTDTDAFYQYLTTGIGQLRSIQNVETTPIIRTLKRAASSRSGERLSAI
jgi:hypothetical protein